MVVTVWGFPGTVETMYDAQNLGYSRDGVDFVGCSTGGSDCVRHFMESREFVEVQRVVVHSSDAGDYVRGSTGSRDCV